jgi:predicted enzyme related to lactoylglutathione lyase
MANPFVHVELNTTDVDKAKAFYRGLFDWKLETPTWAKASPTRSSKSGKEPAAE